MKTVVRAAFDLAGVTLPLASIHPIRQVKPTDHAFGKYKAVVSSIREVGVIEPLIVHPQRGSRDTYLLLDGHMRLKALQELGRTEAFCLIANDDDAFTYNDKVSRLSLIQEHAMIVRAIDQGVPASGIVLEERATNTYENVKYVDDILRDHHWRRILLVSSPYHMRRATMVWHKQAPEVTVIPTPVARSQFYDHTRGATFEQARGILQEYVAIFAYWHRGWL